jgi:guanylate kinase
MKNKKILILGQSASGKDTLRKKLIEKGLRPAISYTTRPPRAYEKDGVDYHFTSLEKFEKLEEEGFFIESEPFRVHNGEVWKYGKSNKTIEDADVFIATPTGISNMLKKVDRNMFWIVEVEARPEIRFERLVSRGDDRAEVNRRMKADAEDFARPRDFKVDEVLTNERAWSLDQWVDEWLKYPMTYE